MSEFAYKFYGLFWIFPTQEAFFSWRRLQLWCSPLQSISKYLSAFSYFLTSDKSKSWKVRNISTKRKLKPTFDAFAFEYTEPGFLFCSFSDLSRFLAAFCWFLRLLQVENVKHESTGVNNAGICAVIDTMQMNSNAPKDARYMMMWRKVNWKQCNEWWGVSVDSQGYRW